MKGSPIAFIQLRNSLENVIILPVLLSIYAIVLLANEMHAEWNISWGVNMSFFLTFIFVSQYNTLYGMGILACIIVYYLFISYENGTRREGMSIQMDWTSSTEFGQNINRDGYLDGIDVIYYINLNRSTERRSHMEKIFLDSVFDEIPVVRINAYDGQTKKMDVYFDIDETSGTYNNDAINNKEYACTLSHLESIQRFSKSPYEIALILEDDITLEYKKYWKTPIEQIMEDAPADWEIIQLCIITENNTKINELYTLHTEDLNSTGAYIIKRNAAKKVIEKIYYNNKYNLDNSYYHAADNAIYKLFKTYTYQYPLFTYKTNNDSTIHSDHLPVHEISKKNITQSMENS